MNGRLPGEGEKVPVTLNEGDWQDAVYRDDNFVDLYGLPLAADKIAGWRAVNVASAVNGAGRVARRAPKTASGPLN